MTYVRAQTPDGDIVTGHLINSGRSYYVLQDADINKNKCSANCIRIDPKSIRYFVGLTTDNREIFEGDIVKAKYTFEYADADIIGQCFVYKDQFDLYSVIVTDLGFVRLDSAHNIQLIEPN